MARSQESFQKKEVRNKKEKRRKEKAAKRLARKEAGKTEGDDMIAYVDANGMLTDTPPDPAEKEKIDTADIEISIPRRDPADESPIRTGVVTFFDQDKGFGFIKDSANNQSVFVHANNLIDPIKDNNLVTFEVEKGHKGPSAVRVKLLK